MSSRCPHFFTIRDGMQGMELALWTLLTLALWTSVSPDGAHGCPQETGPGIGRGRGSTAVFLPPIYRRLAAIWPRRCFVMILPVAATEE
jgi:hypothetical protein